MTWNEYCDIKYFIQKEYHYYLNSCGRYQEKNKEDFEHYRKLENNIANFEKEIITEAIKNISKKDFERMLDK